MKEELPTVVQDLIRKYPAVWDAYNALGKEAAQANPVEVRTERLLKLALAVGAKAEGGVRSHVRRGLAAGLALQEMEQVALLAITTLGWPSALAAYSWIQDEVARARS